MGDAIQAALQRGDGLSATSKGSEGFARVWAIERDNEVER